MSGDDEIEIQLTRLARKYGGANLLWGTALALGVDCPDDYGIAAGRHVAIRRTVRLTLGMASRDGGRSKLRELIANGELESCASLACELDESPQPLTGPVDIVHCQEEIGSSAFRHWVCSHLYALARVDTFEEAIAYSKAHGLELDRTCACDSVPERRDPRGLNSHR